MRVVIKDRKIIAKDYLYITFDSSKVDLTFNAGQFCSVTLINPPYSDNRGNSRFLGFTTSPSDKGSFSILTKMGVSAFKKSLAEIPVGTEVEIGGIDGRIKLPDDKNQALVFVAGGIGIAPIMGILRFCRENGWPNAITLVYVNETRESAAFLDELEGFTKETEKFKLIPVMTADSTWAGEKREVNGQFIKEYFPQSENTLFYVTGIPKFTPGVFKEIRDTGVPPLNIKMEIFTGY